MADYLGLDLGRFQDQMMNYIDIYFNLLKKEKDEPLASIKKEGGIKWKDQIKNLLEYYYAEHNQIWIKSRKESMNDYFDKATKKNKVNIEFYMIMDIAELLYEVYFDKTNRQNRKKSSEHIKKRMAKSIYRELIELRNELGHNENPPYEYILRFYEDQYYLIKFMKPSDAKIKLDDYITKEIKMNIHLYLEKNLKNKKSFELNPLEEEFLKFEETNVINDDYKKKDKYSNKNFTISEDDIKSMFELEPFKLPKMNFNLGNEEQKSLVNNTSISMNNISSINNDNNDNNDKNDEENDIYAKSNYSASHNSLSAFSQTSSLSSSERNSINENTQFVGNIKEKVEQSKSKTGIDMQEEI